MTARKLLTDLQSRGVVFSADGSRLRWKSPAGCVDDDVIAQLKAHKPEILRLLMTSEARHRRNSDGDQSQVRNSGIDPDDDSELNQRRALYVYARRRGFPSASSPSSRSFVAGEAAWRQFAMNECQGDLWDAAFTLASFAEVAA